MLARLSPRELRKDPIVIIDVKFHLWHSHSCPAWSRQTCDRSALRQYKAVCFGAQMLFEHLFTIDKLFVPQWHDFEDFFVAYIELLGLYFMNAPYSFVLLYNQQAQQKRSTWRSKLLFLYLNLSFNLLV
jgi:hypothetical protein